MKKKLLQISQYVIKHPIMDESENYKQCYLNTLEYFVRKYSSNDKYAISMLKLYINKLLGQPETYKYKDDELKKISKGVMAWKMKKFKFFSYRYCLLIDVLFMCAFTDKNKAQSIYQEILEIYNKRYWKKLESLYQIVISTDNNLSLGENFNQADYLVECIKSNRAFLNKKEKNILVTANMSAGKSTLLNALIGKKVNKTQNDSCTAKTHYLLNKAFEDKLSYEYDYDLELDATHEILMKDNDSNMGDVISVGTRFRSANEIDLPVCFIDTPGVNSSQDRVHREISEKDIINEEYEVLVYVLNGENIGTDDDRRHLCFVADNYKGKVIFVVNKLDRFRKEDSVPETLNVVKKDLKGLGFENPIICPVSAYAAYLVKMNMFGEELNDDEEYELERLHRKLEKEEYQFERYYSELSVEKGDQNDKNYQMLLHSGILTLEKLLYEER